MRLVGTRFTKRFGDYIVRSNIERVVISSKLDTAGGDHIGTPLGPHRVRFAVLAVDNNLTRSDVPSVL